MIFNNNSIYAERSKRHLISRKSGLINQTND